MLDTIPGTSLRLEPGFEKNAFAVLTPLLSVTRGLTLGQISELTGLQGSTIQNWVKRGWVANPKKRRYDERQVTRIIILNLLKPCLQLEQIVDIMSFVNGSVEDSSDDIISDRELFNMLCYILYCAEEMHTYDRTQLRTLISKTLENYSGPAEDSKQRLERALIIMSLAYLSSKIKNEAEYEYHCLRNSK